MSIKNAVIVLVLFFLFSLLLSTCIVLFSINKNKVSLNKSSSGEILKPERQPAVAGIFYPYDQEKLNKLLDSFLSKAEILPNSGDLKILIVPHAGLEFSGATAGAGFKQLEKSNFSRAILLGASHQVYSNKIALYPKGLWKTPLGEVGVDNDFASKLLDNKENIVADNTPHEKEHSLEVELIFLQKVLKNFKIVPILIGQVSGENLKFLAKKISDNLDENTILIVSSDLSHYPSWQTANEVDNKTINSILSAKVEDFEKTVSEIENQNYPNLATAACGYNPIKVALMVAETLEIKNFKKIKYENSGDTSGNKDRVVGYGAIGAWTKEKPSEEFLNKESQDEALKIARKTLEKYLSSPRSPSSPPSPQSASLLKPLGAFVTLRKNTQLRGCIGEFEPKDPLYLVIQRIAIAAATEDSRFIPVTFDELKDIKIEISVMTPRKKITDWKKIKLGKEGVVTQSGLRSGTFLPQVAQETGWTLEEFLSQLCSQKAGLSPICYKDPNTTLYTFEVQIFAEK